MQLSSMKPNGGREGAEEKRGGSQGIDPAKDRSSCRAEVLHRYGTLAI